jgi:hypothetical protein
MCSKRQREGRRSSEPKGTIGSSKCPSGATIKVIATLPVTIHAEVVDATKEVEEEITLLSLYASGKYN